MKTAVIFGGSGFIGTFYAQHLISDENYSKVYLFDIESTSNKNFKYREKLVSSLNEIVEIKGDVAEPIDWMPFEEIDLIANFAAVHREPGHKHNEYYECNINGAENVCKWAEKINCNNIIFTSSIAPYGSSEEVKDELSIPLPTSAYGGSKLVAEKIHQIWCSKNKNRKLVIVRPGVVFGPGEGGNVSRLIKAVLKRYFFYMGNKNTRKAGTYVKELCIALTWVYNNRLQDSNFVLFNMTMNPGPSIEEYVNEIKKILNIKSFTPSVPKFLLLIFSFAIELFAKPLGIKHPFSPVRIHKLSNSNNILPTYLIDHGYTYKYTLEEALRDWKDDCPEEWE